MRIVDRTWRRYNDANVVFRPHLMTADQLHEGYLGMWKQFYGGRRQAATEPDMVFNRVQF